MTHEFLNQNVVMVGAGQAALSCAAKLRSLGHTGTITLLGDEPHLPYQRPPLSKTYFTGEMSLERLLLRPQEWFDSQNIRVRMGVRVAEIRRTAGEVVSDTGEVLAYDQLVLATGARPRLLPPSVTQGLSGIHTVRSVGDIDLLKADMAGRNHAVIIGGGYIGLETASVLAKQGVKVTVIEAASRLLERVACAATSAYFQALHESHDVAFHIGTGLAALQGRDGRVSAVRLSNGVMLDCDVLVVGIGIVVNSELAEAADLAVANGIVVDEHGRTEDDSILAIGDCANFPHRGGRLRLESVPHAIAQGENAALTIAGQPQPYVAKPWFWSDQYNIKLQIAGWNAGHDAVVVRGPLPSGEFSAWYYRQGRLVAVDAANSVAAYAVGKRVIEAGQSLPPDVVADVNRDFKSMLALAT
jgi:3-phenylpropionate/trans-cinnamate dioxygenase ferredoxin reductase component